MPVSEHRDAVAKFHHAFSFGCFGIFDPDFTAGNAWL
jgi:hypothetical protein